MSSLWAGFIPYKNLIARIHSRKISYKSTIYYHIKRERRFRALGVRVRPQRLRSCARSTRKIRTCVRRFRPSKSNPNKENVCELLARPTNVRTAPTQAHSAREVAPPASNFDARSCFLAAAAWTPPCTRSHKNFDLDTLLHANSDSDRLPRVP